MLTCNTRHAFSSCVCVKNVDFLVVTSATDANEESCLIAPPEVLQKLAPVSICFCPRA